VTVCSAVLCAAGSAGQRNAQHADGCLRYTGHSHL